MHIFLPHMSQSQYTFISFDFADDQTCNYTLHCFIRDHFLKKAIQVDC